MPLEETKKKLRHKTEKIKYLNILIVKNQLPISGRVIKIKKKIKSSLMQYNDKVVKKSPKGKENKLRKHQFSSIYPFIYIIMFSIFSSVC